MKYLIARTSTMNPAIAGRTLYLTRIDTWTLDRDFARKFDTRADAEKYSHLTLKTRIVEVHE
jgi:hypothetical protein